MIVCVSHAHMLSCQGRLQSHQPSVQTYLQRAVPQVTVFARRSSRALSGVSLLTPPFSLWYAPLQNPPFSLGCVLLLTLPWFGVQAASRHRPPSRWPWSLSGRCCSWQRHRPRRRQPPTPPPPSCAASARRVARQQCLICIHHKHFHDKKSAKRICSRGSPSVANMPLLFQEQACN